jgi:hypothetical protein
MAAAINLPPSTPSTDLSLTMSVAAKRTLFGSIVFCALTIAGVHYGQIPESEVSWLPAQPTGLAPAADSRARS